MIISKQPQKSARLFISILASFLLLMLFPVDAQSQSKALLLREASTGLEIATVDENGVVISVVQSLPDYSFAPTQDASWILHPDSLLLTRQEIFLSPDGNTLAFVAIKNESQFRLVIYQQDADTLIEENLPAYAYPIWSPDNDTLLLEMTNVP